jgi:DNA-binding beta-propeller fold protein YncE
VTAIRRRCRASAIALALGLAPAGLALAATAAPAAEPTAIPISTDGKGIGFDDLRWSPALHRVLVPAGRLGSLVLIDPAAPTAMVRVAAFGSERDYAGGHDQGTTSADAAETFVFAVDRTAREIVVIDIGLRGYAQRDSPAVPRVTARAALGSSPDYVRWVRSRSELWVTEPDRERIEIFEVSKDGAAIAQSGTIAVAGGPESLVIDDVGGRAYAHLWKGKTVAIDPVSRHIVATWPNQCAGSRGIAYDPSLHFLFVGCAEGRAVVMDPAKDGAVLATASAGEGVDVIAYDAARRHLYLPGARSATLTIFSVATDGSLATLGTVPTAHGAHCVTTDGASAWVCDPEHGRILEIADSFPDAKP